jgi:hypothetical protein
MSIYRSPFWNFTIALLCGIALGAAGAVHVVTTRVEKNTAQCVASINSVKDQCLRTVESVNNEWEKTASLWARSGEEQASDIRLMSSGTGNCIHKTPPISSGTTAGVSFSTSCDPTNKEWVGNRTLHLIKRASCVGPDGEPACWVTTCSFGFGGIEWPARSDGSCYTVDGIKRGQ